MRKFTQFMTLVGALMMPAISNAQYITEAPAGGFDVEGGTDYVVLYAPGEVMGEMGDRIAADQTIGTTENSLYYWGDYAPYSITGYEIEGDTNQWGSDALLCLTPTGIWGGVGMAAFHPTNVDYDFTAVTDDHYLHIGLRNNGTKDGIFKFQLGTGESNGFLLTVNKAAGADAGEGYVGIGEVPNDSKWYNIDIPIKDLIDENGDFGFVYDFSKPFAKGGSQVCVITVDGTASTMDGENVTSLGTAFSFDSIFLYKKTGTSGINAAKATSTAADGVYDLLGRPTKMNRPGIYVVKTAEGVRKVAVK